MRNESEDDDFTDCDCYGYDHDSLNEESGWSKIKRSFSDRKFIFLWNVVYTEKGSSSFMARIT